MLTWNWLIRHRIGGLFLLLLNIVYAIFSCFILLSCTYYLIVVLRFIVKDMLGQGTFGQVVKCWDTESNDYIAVKVIKNQPAFYHQAIMEVSLLRTVR
jgi:serine/threonine protein kinase